MFEFLKDISKSLFVSIIISILGIILWYIFWLKKDYLSIPIGCYNYTCNNKENIYIFRGFKDLFSKFKNILIEFNADY